MGGASKGRRSQKALERSSRQQRSRLQETVANSNVQQYALKREVQRRERLERELRRANESLALANEELDSFAYALSHDLKAPLRKCSSLLMFLEEDQSPPLNEAAQGHLSSAVEMTTRMGEMINGVLEYARARDAVQGTEVALSSVVDEVLDNLAVAITEADGKVEVGTLPVVVGHRVRLVQLFQNLVQNAVRYRSERPLVVQIFAEEEEEEGRWRITVRDNGIGMEPKRKADSFILFRRLNRGLGGIGVGLALCKQIVEAHGGTIGVASEVGVGSAFYFTVEAAS